MKLQEARSTLFGKKKVKKLPKLPLVEIGEWVRTDDYGLLRVDCFSRGEIHLSQGCSFSLRGFWQMVDKGLIEVLGFNKQYTGQDGRKYDKWFRNASG